MAVLPTVGGSAGVWGTLLNAWLLTAHNPDGTVKNSGASPSGLTLPVIGSDLGTWGTKLNAWLLVAHNADGTLKNSGASPSGLSLPPVGGDFGTWGTKLNNWLLVAHNADGTLKATPPPVSTNKGIAYMRWGGYQVDPTHPYDIQFVSPMQAPSPAVDEPVLHYFEGSMVRSVAKYGYDQGVSYEEALANGWILKDANGQNMPNVLWDMWVADVGHPGYQAFYANKISAQCRAWGYDGIFNDDFSPNSMMGYNWVDPNNHAAGTYSITPAKYPTEASRTAAMLSFCQGIGAIMQPEFLIMHNAGVWNDDNAVKTKALWTGMQGGCSHVVCELFMQTDHPANINPNQIRKAGTAAWYNYAENWQSLIPHAYSLGLKPVCITYGESEARMQYAWCAFMMEYDPVKGGAHVRAMPSPTYPAGITWASYYNNLLFGGATGLKYMVGTEQRRDYNDGTQLRVDFTLGTSSVILP